MTKGSSWQNFKNRMMQFLDLLEGELQNQDQKISELKFILNSNLPSLEVTFKLNHKSLKLNYSEHHLDYADGMSVSIPSEKKSFAYLDFGVSLAKASDAHVLKRFVDQIVQF